MMNGHKLQVVYNFTYLSRAVQIDDEIPGRTAKASFVFVDFVQMSGSEIESDFTLILKCTRLWYCQLSYMHVRRGQYTCTNVMERY